MPPTLTNRLFFAIELPQEIRERILGLQNEFKKSGADAKWVRPENIHLTLKFLGEVEIERIEELKNVLDKNLKEKESFTVTLFQVGAFPSLKSPRVVWIGLSDLYSNLNNLTNLLEEELSKLGFEKEPREFQAHATIARIRSSRNRTALAEQIKTTNEKFLKQDFKIDNVTLFKSQLAPQGPIYSIIHQVKFLEAK